MEITTEPSVVKVWLLEGNSKTEWDGLWPTATRPHNTSLFTLNDVMFWWSVDLQVHPFARNFEGLLESTKYTLLWGLPSLTHLLINTDKLATNGQLLTLFKAVQVYSRLSIAYRAWNVGKTNIQTARGYINLAFRVTLEASEIASKQIEQLEKNQSAIASFLPFKKPRENLFNTKKRHFTTNSNFKSKFVSKPNPNRPSKNSKFGQKGSDPKAKVCFQCGKPGHLARACRLKGKTSNNDH